MSHKNSGSCLPRRNSGCLGHTCGTSIDLDDVRFTAKKSNLVYMDKVFSYNDATGCPLIVPINTGGSNAQYYKTTLTLSQNGCCCNTCVLDSNAVFTVNDSFVLVDLFETATGSCISRNQVTVDGHCVDSIVPMGGQYLAETTNLVPRIQKECCLENGLPSKTFFLISGAGPWCLRTKIVLTGTVNTGGKTCCFRLEIENAPSAPPFRLPQDRLSNFAITDLSLPCTIKGIAPVIRFQFGAAAQLQNPALCVHCHKEGTGCSSCDTCICDVSMYGNLVIEPKVQVEVIRKTLFCMDGCEAMLPCQGSMEELLSESAQGCPDPFASDCACGNSLRGSTDSNGCGCENVGGSSSGCGCGNVGGCSSGCGCGNVGGCSSGCGCGSVGGCSSGCGCGCDDHDHSPCVQPRSSGGCGNSYGSGCGSVGGSSSGCGCSDHNHNPGIQPRTVSNYCGYNGCSW